ncbi:hypothetical protein EDB81DRAFT_831494 [Dactylonectria macrodidyma]|uniref:Uncharacterized protein n=1 Tax=Dactylonectria macrodidyma TaxID=307937 RepID=A0A9P9D0Z0_9HYPO|nr:hypothetical protein EDB81DRAFT_831494 [Dactylonectria macrodidyma]
MRIICFALTLNARSNAYLRPLEGLTGWLIGGPPGLIVFQFRLSMVGCLPEGGNILSQSHACECGETRPLYPYTKVNYLLP